MIKYITNSDIALRVNLNPFKWMWLPFGAYDKPTPFMPKRHTIAFGWLFMHVYVDIDNGTTDFKRYTEALMGALDTQSIEVKEEDDTQMG